MTYNEWRDELKSNLLCVSETERRRVLDYYAEAYADRREAGYSEREIIEDFGAPYDAAQRILAENGDCAYDAPQQVNMSALEKKRSVREERRQERERERENKRQTKQEDNEYYQSPPPAKPQKQREDYTWVFVLLCVIFCVPLFGLIVAMVSITISFCVAPIIVIISGVATVISSIIAIAAGSVGGGVCALGISIIVIGVGIILCPLFFKLVGLMWTLFTKFFSWLKSLFSGKEVCK